PPPDLLASSAPLPSAASASAGPAASTAAAAAASGTSHHHIQQQRRKASCPKLGENIVMLICLSRVRRMGGRWYRAVSHMRTGKRKKEKKRPYRPADFDRMTEASNAAMDMSETDLAEIVANLLKKVFKEIQDDCREAFVRAWLREDDTRCVLTVPDGKGKMKRIDGLRGSDKVWRLDTLVAMLYHGVPMDSTDTGLLVHRCEDELCVNPRHLSFQCSPAMMAVAMEMLHVAGYDVTPRLAAAAAADPSGNGRYFQFTSPFTVDVIRREMSESMALPRSVLDRYQLSTDDAAYVQDNFPETMSTYRRLLAGDGGGGSSGSVSRASTVGAAGSDVSSTAGIGGSVQRQQQQQQQQQQQHRDRSFLASLSSSAAGLLLKSEAVSPASCSSASATPSSAASAGGGGGVKRPPSESPTNAQMPFKKRRPMSSTDFTPAAAVSGSVYGAAVCAAGFTPITSALFDRRPSSDEGDAAKLGASSAGQPPPLPPPPAPPPLPSHQLQQQQSQSHFDSHHQSHTEDEIAEINRPAVAADAADEREAAATLCALRNSPICPGEYYSVFSEGRLASVASGASNVASSAGAMPAPPLPRPRPLLQRVDGTLAERDHAATAAAAGSSSNPSESMTTSSMSLQSMSSYSSSSSSIFMPSVQAAVSHTGVFRPILPPSASAALYWQGSGGSGGGGGAAAMRGSTTPVGQSPLIAGRNDTPTAIRLILEMQSSQSGGGGSGGGAGGAGDAAVSAAGAARRLQSSAAGVAPSVDQFEHMLRATTGATPTWPYATGVGGSGGGSGTESSPVKQLYTAASATAAAASAASTSAAKLKSSQASAEEQRRVH
ncbi:hypothetical protein BOX15_Mlig013766g2, partial [Macrostomum lignano]